MDGHLYFFQTKHRGIDVVKLVLGGDSFALKLQYFLFNLLRIAVIVYCPFGHGIRNHFILFNIIKLY